jgi:UrcA family protein
MNKILMGIGAGLAASISLGSIAATQDLQEIIVVGTRQVTVTPVGKTSSGVPIVNMSISYGVSYKDLDIASAAGAAELEKRVHTMAKEACKGIAAQRPIQEFSTSEEECAKTAADKAMVKAHALIAEAGKKPAK